MEHPKNIMTLLRRYQRFIDFDDKGRPLHPLDGVIRGGGGGSTVEGARFRGHAVIIRDKEILLEHDGARNEWKLPSTTYTPTKNRAMLLLDKRFPYAGQVIYSNMNNFDEQQSKHSWTESIVKRYEMPPASKSLKSMPLKSKPQWFSKGALPQNMNLFDSIILHQYLKWH